MTASATVRDTTTDDPWHGFQPGGWQHSIDVRGFILANFTPYLGDASFLAGPTDKTLSVWDTLQRDFLSVERARRVYDVETHIPGDVDAFPAGYICADDDVIVGGKMRYVDGRIEVPRAPGLGVELDRDKLAQYHELYRSLGGYPYDRDPGRPGWYPLVPNQSWGDPAAALRPALR